MGQDIVFKGKVRHANSYQEIPNVNIYLQGTNIGTTTDIAGKFSLKIPKSQESAIVVFNHISFYSVEILLTEALQQKEFYLKPRIIQLLEVTITEEKEHPHITKDIPIAYRIIRNKKFDVQGFIDVADLLRTDQSIQVKENLNGKKALAIRGGNPDDVMVLFNGIRMNSLYDNVFDFSLINLNEIKQLEIIRGSNTSLYGAEAVSGIINIIPKMQKNYSVRFQQKIGTYASGDWNINLNHNFYQKFNVSYSYKQGAMTRKYPDSGTAKNYMENSNAYHTASLIYDLAAQKNISMIYFRSNLDYLNKKSHENVSDFNQLLSLRYAGNLWLVKDFSLIGAFQETNNKQVIILDTLFLDRHFFSRSVNFNFEKEIRSKNLDLLLAYQFEDSELDFKDKREIPGVQFAGIQSAQLSRLKNGLAAIFKFNLPTESDLYKRAGIDISYRYDAVKNKYRNIEQRSSDENDALRLNNKSWYKSMLKFSSNIIAGNRFLNFNAYLNYGTNYKFPTMLQQTSLPSVIGADPRFPHSNLDPEKNTNLELGIDLIKETSNNENMDGYQVSATIFKNNFTNKLRIYYVPHSPIAFYDNVQNAEISGLEGKFSLFFIQKKLTVEVGSSNYSIPEKAAFPFKSSHKHILNVLFDHAGYSFQLNWFKETEQFGWLRNLEGEFEEISLPEHANLDFHISKQFELFKFKLFGNFSGINLLNEDTELEGISIRDRRFYITFGFQY